MSKLDDIVESINDYMEHIEYDCSVCNFAHMYADGIIRCGEITPINEEDWECGLSRESIKKKVIEAVKESEKNNGRC